MVSTEAWPIAPRVGTWPIAGLIAGVPLLCYTGLMSQTLSIRLDDELVAALDEEAKRAGITRNRIVRNAIVQRLVHKNLGAFREVVGLMKGPRDLSTNRAYRRTWKRPPA